MIGDVLSSRKLLYYNNVSNSLLLSPHHYTQIRQVLENADLALTKVS